MYADSSDCAYTDLFVPIHLYCLVNICNRTPVTRCIILSRWFVNFPSLWNYVSIRRNEWIIGLEVVAAKFHWRRNAGLLFHIFPETPWVAVSQRTSYTGNCIVQWKIYQQPCCSIELHSPRTTDIPTEKPRSTIPPRSAEVNHRFTARRGKNIRAPSDPE